MKRRHSEPESISEVLAMDGEARERASRFVASGARHA